MIHLDQVGKNMPLTGSEQPVEKKVRGRDISQTVEGGG